MATVTVTRDNFKEITQSGVVLLDFWAAWCGPCRAFAPTFEAASERHTGVTFGKIDTEDQPELAGAFGIRSIPTLMVLRDGILLGEQAGAVRGSVLDDVIAQVQGLDMDEIRREAAAMREQAETEGDDDDDDE